MVLQNKFKAKDVDAAKFLVDLGFKSGNENQDYSQTDTDAIADLTVTIKTTYPGKISITDTTDFKVADGACQIDIMTSKSAGSVVSSYTINIKAASLKVADVIKSDLIKSRDDLKLTAEQGFQVGKATSDFKLEFTNDLNKTKFDSLIKLLNTSITMHFFLSPTQSNEITIKNCFE